jgi:uncharacterized protein YegL
MSNKKTVKKTTVTTTEEIVEMNNNKTQIVCILDRSGSMAPILDDARGGFNSFIEEQKKNDDDVTISVVLFDHEYELLYDGVTLDQVPKMTPENWDARGMTALNDAIGRTINDVKVGQSKLEKEERPTKTLVCIITDGHENSSDEFSGEQIKELIKKQEKNDWKFVFLGADLDAFGIGTNYGISGGNTLSFSSSDYSGTFATMSTVTKAYVDADLTSVNYTATIDNLVADAVDKKKAEK